MSRRTHTRHVPLTWTETKAGQSSLYPTSETRTRMSVPDDLRDTEFNVRDRYFINPEDKRQQTIGKSIMNNRHRRPYHL